MAKSTASKFPYTHPSLFSIIPFFVDSRGKMDGLRQVFQTLHHIIGSKGRVSFPELESDNRGKPRAEPSDKWKKFSQAELNSLLGIVSGFPDDNNKTQWWDYLNGSSTPLNGIRFAFSLESFVKGLEDNKSNLPKEFVEKHLGIAEDDKNFPEGVRDNLEEMGLSPKNVAITLELDWHYLSGDEENPFPLLCQFVLGIWTWKPEDKTVMPEPKALSVGFKPDATPVPDARGERYFSILDDAFFKSPQGIEQVFRTLFLNLATGFNWAPLLGEETKKPNLSMGDPVFYFLNVRNPGKQDFFSFFGGNKDLFLRPEGILSPGGELSAGIVEGQFLTFRRQFEDGRKLRIFHLLFPTCDLNRPQGVPFGLTKRLIFTVRTISYNDYWISHNVQQDAWTPVLIARHRVAFLEPAITKSYNKLAQNILNLWQRLDKGKSGFLRGFWSWLRGTPQRAVHALEILQEGLDELIDLIQDSKKRAFEGLAEVQNTLRAVENQLSLSWTDLPGFASIQPSLLEKQRFVVRVQRSADELNKKVDAALDSGAQFRENLNDLHRQNQNRGQLRLGAGAVVLSVVLLVPALLSLLFNPEPGQCLPSYLFWLLLLGILAFAFSIFTTMIYLRGRMRPATAPEEIEWRKLLHEALEPPQRIKWLKKQSPQKLKRWELKVDTIFARIWDRMVSQKRLLDSREALVPLFEESPVATLRWLEGGVRIIRAFVAVLALEPEVPGFPRILLALYHLARQVIKEGIRPPIEVAFWLGEHGLAERWLKNKHQELKELEALAKQPDMTTTRFLAELRRRGYTVLHDAS